MAPLLGQTPVVDERKQQPGQGSPSIPNNPIFETMNRIHNLPTLPIFPALPTILDPKPDFFQFRHLCNDVKILLLQWNRREEFGSIPHVVAEVNLEMQFQYAQVRAVSQ